MNRPLCIAVYYHADEKDALSQFVHVCKRNQRTQCIPFLLESSVVPINKLKNMGVDAVKTTHYLFAEFNLVPSSTS